MCWTKLKTIGHSLKKLCPSQKTLRPLGVSSWLRTCPSVSGPLGSCRSTEQCTCSTPLS